MNFKSQNLILIKDLLPILWKKQKKIRGLFLLSLMLVLITIGLNLTIPIILKLIVLKLSIANGSISYDLILLLVTLGLIWTIANCIKQIRQIIMVRPLEKCICIFCYNFFEHLHSLSMKFHIDKKIGSLTNVIEKAQQGLPEVFWGLFLIVIPTIIEFFLSALILCYLYGLTYGLVLLLILIIFILFAAYALEWLTVIQKDSNEQQAVANAFIVDSLINFASVKYFNNKKYELNKCNLYLTKSENAVVKYISSVELIRIGHHVIIGCGIVLLTYMAGKQIVDGVFNVSDFVLINGYIFQLSIPLGQMGFVSNDIRRGLNKMLGVMELYKIPNISNSDKNKHSIKRVENISFRNISFSYEGGSVPILSNISFYLPKGKKIGIVGETGSGKSTIASLIYNFYKVDSGEILINGHNVNNIKSSSLCDVLGIVPQDTTLFNTTIYDNILFGKPTASKSEVEEAIQFAGLKSFINKLPNHYNTIVGERGLKLSGGEKQRISIARVLLKQPSLYIFDEATSALDLDTERNIMNNIREVLGGASAIIIAHRLFAVIDADEILVIKNGVIIERGNHKNLIVKNGQYAKLWQMQNFS